MSVLAGFSSRQKAGIRQVDKISDTLPGPRVTLVAKGFRIHHQAVFSQARETAFRAIIAVQYFHQSSRSHKNRQVVADSRKFSGLRPCATRR